ncbi:MAG: NAD(P)H-dependent oxidoreductase [Methylotenera sp.]|nr:NAD(P)H-dependent oxidoreductase [Oligoflexia bacterium]
MNLLEIQASPMESSASREVSTALVQRLLERERNSRISKNTFAGVKIRSVSTEDSVPHWTAAQVQASFTPPESRSSQQTRLLDFSDELCNELIQADTVVIATPMWNFSIPSALKAWIDHIVRVGVTFRYGAHGPEGLLSPNKELHLVVSSGGMYSQGPLTELDHASSYLRHVFGFMGIQKITLIRVENTAMDRHTAVQSALSEIQQTSLK